MSRQRASGLGHGSRNELRFFCRFFNWKAWDYPCVHLHRLLSHHWEGTAFFEMLIFLILYQRHINAAATSVFVRTSLMEAGWREGCGVSKAGVMPRRNLTITFSNAVKIMWDTVSIHGQEGFCWSLDRTQTSVPPKLHRNHLGPFAPYQPNHYFKIGRNYAFGASPPRDFFTTPVILL